MKLVSAALCAAQVEIKNPAMSADNPFHKSKYAPLSAVLSAVKIPLTNHQLVLLQMVQSDPDRVVTRIQHVSGEYIEDGGIPLHCADVTNPQKLMSALTYARRNGICAMLSLVGDPDDDGNNNIPDKIKPVAAVKKPEPAAAPVKVKLWTDQERQTHIEKIINIQRMSDLNLWTSTYKDILTAMKDEDPKNRQIILDAWLARKQVLTNQPTEEKKNAV